MCVCGSIHNLLINLSQVSQSNETRLIHQTHPLPCVCVAVYITDKSVTGQSVKWDLTDPPTFWIDLETEAPLLTAPICHKSINWRPTLSAHLLANSLNLSKVNPSRETSPTHSPPALRCVCISLNLSQVNRSSETSPTHSPPALRCACVSLNLSQVNRSSETSPTHSPPALTSAWPRPSWQSQPHQPTSAI